MAHGSKIRTISHDIQGGGGVVGSWRGGVGGQMMTFFRSKWRL